MSLLDLVTDIGFNIVADMGDSLDLSGLDDVLTSSKPSTDLFDASLSPESLDTVQIDLKFFDSGAVEEFSVARTTDTALEPFPISDDEDGIYPTYPYPEWMMWVSIAVVFGGSACFLWLDPDRK